MKSVADFHLPLCRCDPHSWADSNRRTWRGGEEGPEVLLQAEPATGDQKRCTFSGECVYLGWRVDGSEGGLLGRTTYEFSAVVVVRAKMCRVLKEPVKEINDPNGRKDKKAERKERERKKLQSSHNFR